MIDSPQPEQNIYVALSGPMAALSARAPPGSAVKPCPHAVHPSDTTSARLTIRYVLFSAIAKLPKVERCQTIRGYLSGLQINLPSRITRQQIYVAYLYRTFSEIIAKSAVAREVDRRPRHRQRAVHQRLVRFRLDAVNSG
jgi:hypothetical protein